MDSFVSGDELEDRALPGVEQIDGFDSSKGARKATKKRRMSRGRHANENLNAGHSSDSLPTPWKTNSFRKGPIKIWRKERLVREEKYEICLGISIQSISGVKSQMSGKGWDLKYANVSSSDSQVVMLYIKIPSEFGHSFPCILDDLDEVLAGSATADPQQDMNKIDRESA